MMTLWIAIQTIVDFLILIVVLFYVFERKKRQKEEQNIQLKKEEIQELIGSLDRLITESERSSINISDKALLCQQQTRELIDQLETKKKELREESKKAESLLEKIKTPPKIDPEKKEPLPTQEDKYSEAAKLAKRGFNAEDISKQLDLPKGEVELILDLPPRNKNKRI